MFVICVSFVRHASFQDQRQIFLPPQPNPKRGDMVSQNFRLAAVYELFGLYLQKDQIECAR